jgi:hypothetical protein
MAVIETTDFLPRSYIQLTTNQSVTNMARLLLFIVDTPLAIMEQQWSPEKRMIISQDDDGVLKWPQPERIAGKNHPSAV